MAHPRRSQRSRHGLIAPTIADHSPIKFIDGGGNGTVWAMRAPDGRRVVVKALRNDRTSHASRARFDQEIEVLKNLKGRPGVMPIIDHGQTSEGLPWYSMPDAIPLSRIQALPLEKIISLFVGYAKTLETINAEGISHRDIKPDNLFLLDDIATIGDWGLVKHPDLKHYTRAGGKIGSIHFIAPEMLQKQEGESGDKSDVYSLAKSLWVVATGQTVPMPGEHATGHHIRHFVDDSTAVLLDQALTLAMKYDKGQRISMSTFRKELEACQTDSNSAPQSAADLEARELDC